MLGHVSIMPPSADAYKAIYQDIPSDWRRRPGRPRQSWLATIHRDLRKLDIGQCSLTSCQSFTVEGVDSWRYAPLWCMLLMMTINTYGIASHVCGT